MNKELKEKNKLDLEYQKLIQILNSILTITLTALFGFLGSFTILLEDKNKLALGLSISLIILIIIYRIVIIVNNKLRTIIKKIDDL